MSGIKSFELRANDKKTIAPSARPASVVILPGPANTGGLDAIQVRIQLSEPQKGIETEGNGHPSTNAFSGTLHVRRNYRTGIQ
jgi:hypothetical protein